jgi:glycosyltransferase involved in cell wall biosynthesis
VKVRIVGISLVHNEDVFVERALRNVAGFCDRIHVADHMSTDRTPEILGRLAGEYDHLDVVRVSHTGESHGLVAGYAGTDTWVFGLDGDELYDPERLAGFREELLAGAYRELFQLRSNALNCVGLDHDRRVASGYLAPPSRSITKLWNCAAFDSWTSCYRQYMHDGEIAFRPGYDRHRTAHLGESHTWDETPLRCLHVCFMRRSSLSPDGDEPRLSPIELGGKRRLAPRALARLLDRVRPSVPVGSEWKRDKYRRGELVRKDASPFL